MDISTDLFHRPVVTTVEHFPAHKTDEFYVLAFHQGQDRLAVTLTKEQIYHLMETLIESLER